MNQTLIIFLGRILMINRCFLHDLTSVIIALFIPFNSPTTCSGFALRPRLPFGRPLRVYRRAVSGDQGAFQGTGGMRFEDHTDSEELKGETKTLGNQDI